MAAPVPEKNSSQFVSLLSQLLSTNNSEKVIEIIQDKENKQIIKDESWEIVRVACEYLTLDTYLKSRSLFNSCETVLEEIARVALPEEALLEFLEQIESPDSDEKFSALLKPLQIVLLQLTKRKEQSLSWCLSTIKTYIKGVPIPENQNLEGNEKLLMDADPNVQRINDLYSRISVFYKPFIENVAREVHGDIPEKEVIEKQRQLLISFLLHILEKPLVYLDLEWNSEGAKSSARVSAEEIVFCLGCIMPDVLMFLDYDGPINESSEDDDAEVSSNLDGSLHYFIREDKVPTMSLSVLYYLIFAEGLLQHLLPIVYDPVFVFRSCLHHASVLLKNPEVMILKKGLLLSQAVIQKLPDKKILSIELEHPSYRQFVDVLTHAMVYCGVEECRKLAGTIFKSFLFKFDTKGRYLLMCNLQKTVNHSGTLGYIITLLKDMIRQEIAQKDLPNFFQGKCLYDLVTGYCRLPNGAESDLVELADEIISALNLLRFLLLHDEKNETCIWDHIKSFEKGYFDPLREGLKLSRAHYKLKLRELSEERQKAPGKRSEVTITVGCQQLPDVPYDQKVFLINSALNAFDLMECLLSHINECIEAKVSH
ncbi:Glomulin [Gryllus bimaculatus]|nr:Glomulin [Gryllus bimaculatus]